MIGINRHLLRLNTILLDQQMIDPHRLQRLECRDTLCKAPVDRDAREVRSGERDLRRILCGFCGEILRDQRVLEDSLLEDFLRFSGHGVGFWDAAHGDEMRGLCLLWIGEK